jgi:hypothetical protein
MSEACGEVYITKTLPKCRNNRSVSLRAMFTVMISPLYRTALVERSRLLMKVLSWIIALLGLWEFADIAALFVPDFGRLPDFLWNHIIIGFLLMIVGVWAARTSNAGTAKRLHWIASGTGIWLMISSFMLRYPVIGAGLWNDLIVGATAFVLGVWADLSSPRATD